MAVEHREDSIIELEEKRKKEKLEDSVVGKQIAKLMLQNIEKDKKIDLLGKQAVLATVKAAKLEKQVEELKKENGGK